MKRTIYLKKWKFALGEGRECLEHGREVMVPHTWNIEEGSEDLQGCGWYEYSLYVPEEWGKYRIRAIFQAVYHSAAVFVNAVPAGGHEHSGYTPFEVEITDYLTPGKWNSLTVKVDNTFSERLLPYKRSFDWPNDGGIIRDVRLEVTGKMYLEDCAVTAKPVITAVSERQDRGYGIFGCTVAVNGQSEEQAELEWELYSGCDGKERFLTRGSQVCREKQSVIENRLLADIHYWHFDDPALYTLKLRLLVGDTLSDEKKVVFGFRDFHVEGDQFCLNGEYIRVCGTEWMPGSDPEYGMAEPKEHLEKMLTILKESNCVFTRFHWQQDDAVFDWCDRHGMLVQEEVPFWGPDPAVAGETQWEIFQQQIREMVRAHRNHPAIIAWGVGNELTGQEEATIQYVKNAVAFTGKLDPGRMVNYVSNSYFNNPAGDAVLFSDAMLINDYIGTWIPGLAEQEELEKILAAMPDKPLVPSEFGLCEPAFSGGDERRKRIFLDKMAAYRNYAGIAGAIYFCLNDYRTQMGEAGEGRYRQRVHGSTDLTGTPKPSYWTVQKECAPFVVSKMQDTLTIFCRQDLPCYEMRGFSGAFEDSAGNVLETFEIPSLRPGECFHIEILPDSRVSIFRGNGDRAGTFEI